MHAQGSPAHNPRAMQWMHGEPQCDNTYGGMLVNLHKAGRADTYYNPEGSQDQYSK